MSKIFSVKYSDRYIWASWIPVEAKALAAIYGLTYRHVQERNPRLSEEQVETVTRHLLPTVCYVLYRSKR